MGVLEVLKSTAQAISSAKTLKEAMQVLLEAIAEQTQAAACSLFILDERQEDFLLVASTRAKYVIPGQYRIPCEEGLLRVVAAQAEPIRLDQVNLDPRYTPLNLLENEETYQAFLGVPLIHAGEVLGIVIAQNVTSQVFSEGDEAFVVTLSAQLSGMLAQALENGQIVDIMVSDGKHRALKLQGVGAASGVAMGEAVVILPQADFSMVFDRASEDISGDLEKLDKALEAVRKDVRAMDAQLAESLGEDERALFGAYLKILDSKSFTQTVIDKVQGGQWVQSALKDVVSKNAKVFEEMPDEYLKERAADIWDLGQRVLSYLQSLDQGRRHYAPDTILMGAEITASMLAEVPKKQLKAIVSIKGSINSHVSILANALGIPAVMGVESLPLELVSGRSVIVDGYTGRVFVDPHQGLQKVYRRLLNEEQELQENLRELSQVPAETTDGTVISLKANVGLIADIDTALIQGADGVGLYRSEVPFMIRDRFPGEEEQRIIYRQFLESFYPKVVVMRVLDIGGDKDLPYFQFPEENPYLGWRGIRILLDHPEIFAQQIRAMLKASINLNNLQILLPMVSRLDEIVRAKALIWEVYQEELAERTPVLWPKVGVMVEVPSLVQVIDDVLDLVDFVSIGTNDLTQYMLAVDRNNAHVESYYDSFDPSVLRALSKVATRAKFYGKPCSLCGEMAGDPLAAILLLGLGFSELSMSASKLLRIKWVIRGVSLEKCQSLAQKSLSLRSSQEVRALFSDALVEAGFGSLVSTGNH